MRTITYSRHITYDLDYVMNDARAMLDEGASESAVEELARQMIEEYVVEDMADMSYVTADALNKTEDTQ